MATVSDNLIDAATRHNIYLLRWSRSTYRRHLNLVDDAFSDLVFKLSSRAPDDGSFTAARLRMMIDAIEKRTKELYTALEDATDGDYRALAAYEAEFQVSAIQGAYPIELKLNTVTPAQIHAAAMSQPFLGKVLRDWWKGQEASTRDFYNRAVRIGYVNGETISQVTSRLRQVTDKSRREIEAIVRTATIHMSQVARNKVAEANEELFAYEEWVSTLDGRTSAICRGRDGKRYKIGKGEYPPAHFGCRSQRVPVTKSWAELGFGDLDDDESLSTRPFVADKRSVKDIPKSLRKSVIGQTTAKSYNEWLKTQPRSFVEDVLGKQKAKLYLDGNLSLDKFVDRQGDELTLDQLKASESKLIKEAWNKAFGG